jgi:hypothetical protein
MAGFSMGDPLRLRQVRGVLETTRRCVSPLYGTATNPQNGPLSSRHCGGRTGGRPRQDRLQLGIGKSIPHAGRASGGS